MYRALRTGTAPATKGADVKQIQENLMALGYRVTSADGLYTSTTAQAVRRWQADLGMPQTGAVEPGDVVFVPGPVRIAEHRLLVGDRVGDRAGPVLVYTGTIRLVTVQLDITDRALVAVGSTTTVTVPGGARLEGKVAAIGAVVSAPQVEGGGQDSPGSAVADARVQVTVSIADQASLGDLDTSPVDVDFVSQERRDVLAVPVVALLALPEGGYGVEIVEGGTTRVVPVETGMFAASMVEISGPGITEGMQVGVPK
jgi:peptidoglycan hydrolase-like protein with peptidoglycan-binding domain